ncbi:MAG: DMT family transporter [Lachnospiraceae bacterium]|nr:DMT family transporter [Lachnospiraceae bacterium]
MEKTVRDENTTKKLIILAAVFGTASSSIMARFSTCPSMVLTLYRMMFTCLIMAGPGLADLKVHYRELKPEDYICCFISGFFLAVLIAASYECLKYTSVAAAVLLTDSEVFFVAFLQRIFFKEKITGPGWAAILITFAGSMIVALGDAASGSGGSNMLKGDLIALAGAFFMAMTSIMGKKCRVRMTNRSYTGLQYLCTLFVTIVILLLMKIPFFGYDTINYSLALGQTVICTLLGLSVFSWGLKYLNAAFISTAKLAEPVFSSILALIIFHEIPPVTTVIGGIVVISGILLYLRQKN